MSGLTRSDIDDVLRLIDGSDFDELKLEMGDTKIELRKRGRRRLRLRPRPLPLRPNQRARPSQRLLPRYRPRSSRLAAGLRFQRRCSEHSATR